jgi:hypothetical protein
VTPEPTPISVASPRVVLQLALVGRPVSREAAALASAEPYDLFIGGEWNKSLPEFLALVELAEEAAGAGDMRLTNALTAWTVHSISQAWILTARRAMFAKLPPREGRARTRLFLERASSGRGVPIDVEGELDERIVGPGGFEDFTGDAVSPFGFKGLIDSTTHFRSDRAQIVGLLGDRSAIPALCRPCFGQSVCPENCPATRGQCGKDFLGVYVRNASKVFSFVTGSLGRHRGVEGGARESEWGKEALERRKEALDEMVKTVGESLRPPTRKEIAASAAKHHVGFTGAETGIIRRGLVAGSGTDIILRDLEHRARQKNPS